jgi:putative endonuclease
LLEINSKLNQEKLARHNDTGKLGEELAQKWLFDNGYQLTDKNWRCGHWEIDLIAVKNDKLHFFEVKTRRSSQFGFPEDLVDKKKLHFFISAGTEYIRQYPVYKWICFNILSITLYDEKKPEFFLIEDVYT